MTRRAGFFISSVCLWLEKKLFKISLWSTAKLENVLLDISETESDVKENPSTFSGPVETPDFTDILEQSEGSEDDSFVDLKLEEEQQEPCPLLTGQGDFEEQPSPPRTEEEGDEVEEKVVAELAHTEENQEAEWCSSGDLR